MYLQLETDVYECFERILARRKPPKKEPMIGGYAGFLWFDKDGKPCVKQNVRITSIYKGLRGFGASEMV